MDLAALLLGKQVVLSELFATVGAEFLVFLNYPTAVGANPSDLLLWRLLSIVLWLGTVLRLSVSVGLRPSRDWLVDQREYSANQSKQSAHSNN